MSFSEKYLFQRLNIDDANNVLQKGSFRELENGRIGVTADKTRFLVENIKGNVEVTYSLPAGNNKLIGDEYSKQANKIFFFIYNSMGNHGIYQIENDVVTSLLLWSGLSFSESKYITQIDYINGDLYWTNNINEPRFINVSKAIAGDYSNPKEEDITVIRRPPMYPLGVARQTDATRVANNIADHAFQFAYRYVYEGNKYSVLSTYSKLINYAISADASKNYISVSIPGEEVKPFGVRKTQLLSRKGNAGEWYIWKDVLDATITFNFYNDTLGIIEPNINERELFHDVPRKAVAQAFIGNRLFYDNYLKGYSLTQTTSLTASLTVRASTESVNWRVVEFAQIHKVTDVFTVLGYWTKNPNDGLYYEVSYDSGTDTVTHLGGGGKTYTEVETFYNADHNTYYYQMPPLGYYTFDVTTDTDDPFVKKGGSYQVSILFTDFAGRNVGVLTNDASKVYLSDDPTDTDKYVLGWDISTAATSEIPDWATNYYILRTNNLSHSLFLQGHTSDIWLKAGNNNYWKTRSNSEFLYIDVSTLTRNETGYTFVEGDRIKIWNLNSNDYDFKIESQEGQFIVVKNPGIDTLTNGYELFFEIFRSALVDQEQLYYEVGEAFEVLNPGTPSKDFSVKTGRINGDTFEATRDKWPTSLTGYDSTDPFANDLFKGTSATYEAMNPVDEHYTEWITDAGRVSLVIENPEEKRSTTTLCYSGELLPDSNWNELNVFTPSNRYDKVGEEYTPVVALTVVKDHLIAHHERNTSSYLVGEGVTYNVNGQLTVKTSNVIGNHSMLVGGHGCLPTTIRISKDMDSAWWLDPLGYVVRYTQAGVKPVSNAGYGIERKIKDYCLLIRNGIIDTPKAGYDPDTKEYFIQIPSKETLIFSEDGDSWTGSVSLISSTGKEPEGFANSDVVMYSFLDGSLWKHEGNVLYNNFYGIQQKRKLHFVINVDASKNKVWQNLWIESNALMINSLNKVVEISNESGQYTYLMKDDFSLVEGDWKAAIRFDKNTPNLTPEQAIKRGDRMRSKTIDVVIHSDLTDVNALKLVTIIFGISPYTL